MYEIVDKKGLGPQVTWFRVAAPDIARKRKAGQFVMLRVGSDGERIPLTIADADPQAGTITLVSQSVGKTTGELAALNVGDRLADLVGPLGTATHIEKYGTTVSVGGGIGVAPIYPITQALQAAGNHVISILGARTKDLLIMEDMMRAVSDETLVVTDDGSHGQKGFVTTALQGLIDAGRKLDLVIAIGPPIMMKMVVKVTRPHNIKTLVSLNSIMIDGTGMCGGCRVSVGGKSRFVCVDGPEFDGFDVDFDGLMQRLSAYRDHECQAVKRWQQQA